MDWIEQALSSVFGGAKQESEGVVPAPKEKAPDEASRWFPDLGVGTRRPSLKMNSIYSQNAKTPATASTNSFDNVFKRLINAESRGKHLDASGGLTTSPVGAQGIAQVMPKTSKRPGFGVLPLQDDSEKESLRFGKDYLQAMVTNFNGDIEKAVAAYNAGPKSVQNAVSAAAESGKQWWQHLPKKKETLPYMEKILGQSYKDTPSTSLKERGEVMTPGHVGDEKLFNRELSYLLKRAEDNPEFQTLHGFLKSRGAVPKLEAEFSSGNRGSFNYKFDPQDVGTVKVGGTSGLEDSQYFRGNDSAIVQPRATLIHEMTHAADRQIGSLVGELVNKKSRTALEDQLIDAWDKTLKVKSKGGKSSFDSAKIAEALDAKWFEGNKDYRTTRTELPAQAMGAVSGATNMPGQKAKPHVDTTVATDFMVLLEMAQRVINQNRKDE